MRFLTILALGLATNLDNLLMALAFGLQKKRISYTQNLFIGLVSAFFTYLSCLVASCFAGGLARVANLAGAVLIMLLGISILIHPEDSEAPPRSLTMTEKDLWTMSLALGCNCIAVSFGAGMTGIAPLPAALCIGGFSLLCVAVGNCIGSHQKATLSAHRINRIPGGILIGIGILECII